MRINILCLLLFPTIVLISQTPNSVVEKELYMEFDTLNKSFLITISLPENHYAGSILYRYFYFNSQKIQSEYIKLTKDTLLYVEYDTAAYPKIIKKGYVYLSNDCLRADTVVTVDPMTYEPKMKVTLGCMPIKNGFWREYQNDYHWFGMYQNGKKQGSWLGEILYPNGNVYYTYRNDTLVQIRQVNLLKTNSLDTIRAQIIGRFTKSKYNFRRLFPDEFGTAQEFYYIFNADGTGQGEHLTEYQGRKSTIKSNLKWTVTPQYLTINFDTGIIEKYKLSFVNERAIVFDE
jgi:hypothetical protein